MFPIFQKIAMLFSKIMVFCELSLAVYMKKEYTMSVLEIKNLHVSVEDKEILKGLNLTLKTGEIAAIMGPNGTGKSTLSAAIIIQTMRSQKVTSFLMVKASLTWKLTNVHVSDFSLPCNTQLKSQGLRMLSSSVRL